MLNLENGDPKDFTRLGSIIITNRSAWQVYTQRFISAHSYATIDIRPESDAEYVYVDQVAIRPAVDLGPILFSISDQVVNFGSTLRLTNAVLNANSLAGPWRFTLDPGAPPDASIDPDSGEFIWTPPSSAISSNSLFTVRATHLASGMSKVATFNVLVVDLKVGLGNVTFTTGQTGSIPVNATLVLPLVASRLTFSLFYPADLITILSASPAPGTGVQGVTFGSVPGGYQINVDSFVFNPSTNFNTVAYLNFSIQSGGSSQIRNLLIRDAVINYPAPPRYPHELTPLSYPPPQIQPGGRLSVIGEAPLLSVGPVSNSQFYFQVLGRAGATFDLESTTSLSPPFWQVDQTVTLTNASQALAPSDFRQAMRFYRLKSH